jgi:hypothetical protein
VGGAGAPAGRSHLPLRLVASAARRGRSPTD